MGLVPRPGPPRTRGVTGRNQGLEVELRELVLRTFLSRWCCPESPFSLDWGVTCDSPSLPGSRPRLLVSTYHPLRVYEGKHVCDYTDVNVSGWWVLRGVDECIRPDLVGVLVSSWESTETKGRRNVSGTGKSVV